MLLHNIKKVRPNNLKMFKWLGYRYMIVTFSRTESGACTEPFCGSISLLRNQRDSTEQLQMFVSIILNYLCLYKGLIPDKDLKWRNSVTSTLFQFFWNLPSANNFVSS